MTEEFALRYAETRRAQLGATSFDVDFRHLSLKPAEEREFGAQGQMWLIIRADPGILVNSDKGQFYPQSNTLLEHFHEHTGQLTVANKAPAIRQIQFVVISWVFPPRPVPVSVPAAAQSMPAVTITTGNNAILAPTAPQTAIIDTTKAPFRTN